MMEKDAYVDHPDEVMVTLQRELFLSASMVVDSGIHQQGWSLAEGSIYLENQTGIPRVKVRDTVNRFAVNPGQVLAYKMGYEKFMELRDYAKQSLGARFSLVDYHEWLMAQGNMPLSISWRNRLKLTFFKKTKRMIRISFHKKINNQAPDQSKWLLIEWFDRFFPVY